MSCRGGARARSHPWRERSARRPSAPSTRNPTPAASRPCRRGAPRGTRPSAGGPNPVAPSVRPARTYSGGTWRIPCSVASVTAGNDPAIATNTTARSVTPNQITASGTHATNGVICSATTSGRMLRRASSKAASTRPSAVPIRRAAAKENASRIRALRGRLGDRAVGEAVAERGPHRGRSRDRRGVGDRRDDPPDEEERSHARGAAAPARSPIAASR